MRYFYFTTFVMLLFLNISISQDTSEIFISGVYIADNLPGGYLGISVLDDNEHSEYSLRWQYRTIEKEGSASYPDYVRKYEETWGIGVIPSGGWNLFSNSPFNPYIEIGAGFFVYDNFSDAAWYLCPEIGIKFRFGDLAPKVSYSLPLITPTTLRLSSTNISIGIEYHMRTAEF